MPKLKPGDITRADVKALIGKIEAPILANQVLASASAIFSWAIKQEMIPANPCKLVDRNATRQRIDMSLALDLQVPNVHTVARGQVAVQRLALFQHPWEELPAEEM